MPRKMSNLPTTHTSCSGVKPVTGTVRSHMYCKLTLNQSNKLSFAKIFFFFIQIIISMNFQICICQWLVSQIIWIEVQLKLLPRCVARLKRIGSKFTSFISL